VILEVSLIVALPGPRRVAALAISRASSAIAATRSSSGSWAITIGSGAGTWSGIKLNCAGCTVILLAGWVPCSLHLAARPDGPTATRPASTSRCRSATRPPSPARPARGRLEVGPLGRDQRLAAVGQHQQQLQTAMPAHLAQLLQPLALERMADTSDHHRAHRPTPSPARRPRRGGRPRAAPPWPPARGCAVQAAHGIAQIHRAALGQARGQPQHARFAARARQPARLQRCHRASQSIHAIGVPSDSPRRLDEPVDEVGPFKPAAVADQQLNRSLSGIQAPGVGPQRRREVLETGSESGSPSTTFHTPHS
jgi:hypothetical protein